MSLKKNTNNKANNSGTGVVIIRLDQDKKPSIWHGMSVFGTHLLSFSYRRHLSFVIAKSGI